MLIPQHLPRADLTISVSDGPLYPGGTLKVHVSVVPQDTFRISIGRLELVQREVSTFEDYRIAGPMGASAMARRHSAPLRRIGPKVAHQEIFLNNAEVSAGVPYQAEVAIPIPYDASPTAKGKVTYINWELRASLAVGRAETQHDAFSVIPGLNEIVIERHSVEVVVFAAPQREYQLDPKPWSTLNTSEASFNQCVLSLFLPVNQVKNGETLEGILKARMIQSVRPQELRVELVRWERSGSKQSETVEERVVLDRAHLLRADTDLERPFLMRIPDRLLPSLSTSNSFVGWHVKGILARRFRPDLSVGQLIQVYTGP